MSNRLAIIIPAYKSTYLHETLRSIANQSCKDFTVYIGDDASPNELYAIIKEYEKDIDIIYQRFDENLGGKDLIAHWERCIDMSADEEWLWMFSDDDIMESNCVELFYKYIESDKESKLLHFNVDIIDGESKKIATTKAFPSKMTSSDFFKYRLRGEISSFVVEYIFSRKLYLEEGKFEKFDLAWCSDDATWLKFSRSTGITTIEKEALINWRYSGQNISSLNIDESILFRKLNARLSYLKWATDFLIRYNGHIDKDRINTIKWVLIDINEVKYLNFIRRVKFAYNYAKITGGILNGLLGVLYISYINMKNYSIK